MRSATALAAATLSGAMLLWAVSGGTAVTSAANGLVQRVAGHAFVVEGWRWSRLAAGAQLHAGDTLQAGRDGPFQITFAGDVILTVAAGARITLSRSVFVEHAEADAAAKLLRGIAREITGAVWGLVLHERVLVPTPSIGVRG